MFTLSTTGATEATRPLHPEIGRPVEDMPADFREWLIPFGDAGYLVLYRYDGRLIALLAVRHGREAGY